MRHGRLHWYTPDELDADQRAYYDQLLSGPRDPKGIVDEQGRLVGAFNARVLDPRVGTVIQELGAALRFGTVLTDRQREIAILTVAEAEQCSYEWNAHAQVARKVGIVDSELDELRAGKCPASLPSIEERTWKTASLLAKDGDLPDEDYAAAVAELGEPAVFALVSIVGYYQHTALAIRVWRVPLRDGDTEAFGT
jgi:4-carboxymuconolactone decarboxylase